MSKKMIGFFCKTGDPEIYKWKSTTFPDLRFSYADYKDDWLKTEGNIVIEQEVESTTFDEALLIQEDGVIVRNDEACRTCARDTHFKTLKDRRKELQFGWFICATIDAETRYVYADTYNREVINGAAPVVINDKALIETEFSDGLKVKTESGVWYVLTADEVYPIYRGLHMTTQAMFNIEEEVQKLIKTDFDSDMSFEDFQSKDYIALASIGFNAKLEAKIVNTAIFAQPTTEPEVI